MCCRNHSVPHLSEDHCEVLSDVGASDPTATGSRHGHGGSPRSHRPVDKGFPSSPGWCRSCVLRRCHPLGENLGRRTWHRLDYICLGDAHARSTGRIWELGSIEEYYRRTIYVPYVDYLIQSLESRFGENNTPYFHISHYIREKCSKQKEMNSSTSFHLSRKCMAL